jgi:signal transduction histidine kinase
MIASPVLMPHAVCWAAAPRLIWTMVVTNLITFFSYLSICCTLLYLAKKTSRVIARDWAYFTVGFALFIVACGSTHLLEVITTWIPIFWVDAATNIVTAVLSAYIAIQLIRRAFVISFSINDYAARLANAEDEKRQMETALLASQKLEDWSRMSSVVAHEIANPLEAVQNLLYLIRTQEGVSPDVVKLAATANEEAANVLTLSRSALSFFRQSAEPERTDLLAAAESVRLVLASTLSRQQIHLRILGRGDLSVEAFAGEPRQVLLNLIRNACEASPNTGSDVAVSLNGLADSVAILISDKGSGISHEVLANLFQFGKTTKGEQGNGMGLWTVKHLLDRHNATIHVDSVEGIGTTFTIKWPRKFSTKTSSGPVLAARSA